METDFHQWFLEAALQLKKLWRGYIPDLHSNLYPWYCNRYIRCSEGLLRRHGAVRTTQLVKIGQRLKTTIFIFYDCDMVNNNDDNNTELIHHKIPRNCKLHSGRKKRSLLERRTPPSLSSITSLLDIEDGFSLLGRCTYLQYKITVLLSKALKNVYPRTRFSMPGFELSFYIRRNRIHS